MMISMNDSRPYSTEHIDYLQRIGLVPRPVLANTKVTEAPAQLRRLFQVKEIGVLAERRAFRGYPSVMRKVFKYLSRLSSSGPKPNLEAGLNAEFKRVQASTVSAAKKSRVRLSEARVSCLWPAGGIQHNTVNRLLLMSSSEHHLASAPMALFVKSNVPER